MGRSRRMEINRRGRRYKNKRRTERGRERKIEKKWRRSDDVYFTCSKKRTTRKEKKMVTFKKG